jgi:hypothetical protein
MAGAGRKTRKKEILAYNLIKLSVLASLREAIFSIFPNLRLS